MNLTVEAAAKISSAALIAGSVIATLVINPAFLWVTVALGVTLVLRALTGYCAFTRFFSLLGLPSDRSLQG